MTTFIEAFETHGRDSAAISEAMGVHESVAYNMMADRVELDVNGSCAALEKSLHRQAMKKAWRERQKADLQVIRDKHRMDPK